MRHICQKKLVENLHKLTLLYRILTKFEVSFENDWGRGGSRIFSREADFQKNFEIF